MLNNIIHYRLTRRQRDDISSIIISLKYYSEQPHTVEQIRDILIQDHNIELSVSGIRRYISLYNKKNIYTPEDGKLNLT